MNPVCLKKQNQKYHRTDKPGKWICPVDYIDHRNNPDNNTNIGYPDSAPYKHHNKHRNNTSSRPSLNCCHTMRKRKQTIEKSDRMCLCNSIFNCFLISSKRSDQVWLKEKNCYSDHFCYPDSTNGSKQCPFFCPVILFCSQILSNKRRECL